MKYYRILVHYGFLDEDGEIEAEQEDAMHIEANSEEEALNKCAESFNLENIELFEMNIDN